MHHAIEEGVIARIASGEERALSELYARHAQTLYNYAVRVLRSEHKAEDAVSALFHSVWTGSPAWPGSAPQPGVVLTGWLRHALVARIRGVDRGEFRVVDIWSMVSARELDDPLAKSARAALGRCGVVSTGVLSLVYFGGQTIAAVARRMSMKDAECRSRLQVCLDALAHGLHGALPGRSEIHGGRFAAAAAAFALGAMSAAEDAAFANHLGGGCACCEQEIARYAEVAHTLPHLLPDVRLPADLHERILFSVRLAGIPHRAKPERAVDAHAGPGPAGVAGVGGDRPESLSSPWTETAGRESARPATAPKISRRAVGRWAPPVLAIAVVAILLLGYWNRRLGAKLEEESQIMESMQNRHTDLLLKYDRLAGISEFFESRGIVTVLSGTSEYPGLTGKIVWDSAGGSAMLQILNPPDEVARGRLRVIARGAEAAVKVAEFAPEPAGDGRILYRFFPVDVEAPIAPGGFTVDFSPSPRGEEEDDYRGILEGAVPPRHGDPPEGGS